MKNIYFLPNRISFRAKTKLFIVLLILPFINGCAIKMAVNGEYDSEKPGVGASLSVGEIGLNENWDLNGVIGFNSYFDNNDTDTYAELGIQGRRKTESSPFWFGGELSYINDISNTAHGYWDSNANANGFSIGALGAYQLPFNSVGVAIVPKVSYVGFLDGSENVDNAKYNTNGFRFLLGLEIALPFLQ